MVIVTNLFSVKNVPKDELIACLPYLYTNLEDRNADVRKSANEAVYGFMIHLSYQTMFHACEKVKVTNYSILYSLSERLSISWDELPFVKIWSSLFSLEGTQVVCLPENWKIAGVDLLLRYPGRQTERLTAGQHQQILFFWLNMQECRWANTVGKKSRNWLGRQPPSSSYIVDKMEAKSWELCSSISYALCISLFLCRTQSVRIEPGANISLVAG